MSMTRTLTVKTLPVQVWPPDGAQHAGPFNVLITNEGSNPAYLMDAEGTKQSESTKIVKIASKQVIPMTVSADQLWAICAAGEETTISVLAVNASP